VKAARGGAKSSLEVKRLARSALGRVRAADILRRRGSIYMADMGQQRDERWQCLSGTTRLEIPDDNYLTNAVLVVCKQFEVMNCALLNLQSSDRSRESFAERIIIVNRDTAYLINDLVIIPKNTIRLCYPHRTS
jgi:hypothetical protein